MKNTSILLHLLLLEMIDSWYFILQEEKIWSER